MHINECDIPDTPLDITYVGSVNVGELCELLLRKPSCHATLAHGLTESRLEIAISSRDHGKSVGDMMYIGLHVISGIDGNTD